ncbi:DENN domain-containing protein 1A [Camelus ferus]|nr:DENN domain-containing protein 1A [Camelus ferus]
MPFRIQLYVSALKNKLKKQSTATGDGVARAFLRAQAALFGSYRDALRYKPGEPITFCEESFVKHRSSVMKQFLETAVNLQLFKQENEEDYGTCSGSVQYTPVYTLHSEKGENLARRKLAQPRLRRTLKSLDGALCEDDGDDIERASNEKVPYPLVSLFSAHLLSKTAVSGSVHQSLGRLGPRTGDPSSAPPQQRPLSSEDGEEASPYFYESDDSLEMRAKAPYSGEMDLLGEILDTLSTHSSDQGKLAAARSLDFFRSMDDIEYQPTSKSSAPSESSLGPLCSGSGDQAEWHLGQDDSALHGRHLPPSPRKRLSSGAATESLFILKEESRETPGKPAPPSGPAVQLASPETATAESRDTLSQPPDDPLEPSLGRRSSTFVPWEKEGRGAEDAAEGAGLLQEVVSLCHITSAFQQDLNISEGKTGGNQA